ncbi:hypothetical protein Tco_1007575 [Tanacetum coccineum]
MDSNFPPLHEQATSSIVDEFVEHVAVTMGNIGDGGFAGTGLTSSTHIHNNTGGNNGDNKNFKPVLLKPKTVYRPKAKKSVKGMSKYPKTTPFVGTSKASTSGYNKDYTKSPSNNGNGFSYDVNLVSLINSFEALNDGNSVLKEVGKLVLVDDDGKPHKNFDYLGNMGSGDEIEQVDNEIASFLASNPMGVRYVTKSLLEQ